MATLLYCGRCPMCEQPSLLRVDDPETARKVTAWMKMPPGERPFIQDVFPQMSPGDREMILTGSHEACFDEAFPDE